jgi:hypothetical protein
MEFFENMRKKVLMLYKDGSHGILRLLVCQISTKFSE